MAKNGPYGRYIHLMAHLGSSGVWSVLKCATTQCLCRGAAINKERTRHLREVGFHVNYLHAACAGPPSSVKHKKTSPSEPLFTQVPRREILRCSQARSCIAPVLSPRRPALDSSCPRRHAGHIARRPGKVLSLDGQPSPWRWFMVYEGRCHCGSVRGSDRAGGLGALQLLPVRAAR